MPRKLKPYPVSVVDDRMTGIKVQILFDREDKTFFANVMGAVVSANTANECEAAVRDLLKRNADMLWRKIILVHIGNVRSPGAIDLEHSIHEIADKKDEAAKPQWIERTHWTGLNGKLEYTYRDFHSGKTASEHGDFVLPWSKETEATLNEIEKGIQTLNKRIHNLLSGDNAGQHLADMARKMLPMKKESDE